MAEMTLVGYLLVTVITQSSLFDNNTMGVGQSVLPPEVDCAAVAKSLKDSRVAQSAYCIPLYKK